MKHIIECLGKSEVTIEDGKVTKVTEPEIEYCPLFDNHRNIKELTKEAIKEKTTNKTSLICDLLNEALDYRSGDYKDPCVSMLTNVIDNQNKIIDILFEIISKMDKKELEEKMNQVSKMLGNKSPEEILKQMNNKNN